MKKTFSHINELTHWLTQNDIDLSIWGQGHAKTVENLWKEYQTKEIRLQDLPLRHVSVVQLIIVQGNSILLEIAQELVSGQMRYRFDPPAEKMLAEEDVITAVYRCLQEELNIPAKQATILADPLKIHSLENSRSYPGLTTNYTFYPVKVAIAGLPNEDFWVNNESHELGDPIVRHCWGWRTIEHWLNQSEGKENNFTQDIYNAFLA